MKKVTKLGQRCPECKKGFLSDKICVDNYHDTVFQCTYCDYAVSDVDIEAEMMTTLYAKIVSFMAGVIVLGFAGICYLLDECWSLEAICLIGLSLVAFAVSYFTKMK